MEFNLSLCLLRPENGATLLDVGCGTGYFARRCAREGLQVTGLDPDECALSYARDKSDAIAFLAGKAEALPFADHSFDYCIAMTSLCFVGDPGRAVAEMWRVSRRAVLLGLLNRRSLLYRQKHERGLYKGARWDEVNVVKRWRAALQPPAQMSWGTAIYLPSGGGFAQRMEKLIPRAVPWGGFLAVCLSKCDL